MSIWLLLKSKIGLYAAAIGGLLLSIFMIFRMGGKSARNKIKIDTMEAEIEIMEKDNVIDENIDNSSDAALRERMQRDHSSDD